MFVYLREDPVRMEVRNVDADGLIPADSELVAVAFYVNGNELPSFRSLLPSETITSLKQAAAALVRLGLMAEEPENSAAELHAMVGMAIPVIGSAGEAGEERSEPWRAQDPDVWKGDEEEEAGGGMPHLALLTFAPLVRLTRKFPFDLGEELADLLESALAGSTRPALEARVDRMLGDL
jgi:hypothetical protein